MNSTPEEKQNDQTQKKTIGGGINQGIKVINNLVGGGFKNPFGKISSRVVTQTALRGFFTFLVGPVFPIVIALIAIFVFTLIIVGLGGAPSSEQNNQTANVVPTKTTTSTITPIPVEP
jgi:hypothetical protein